MLDDANVPTDPVSILAVIFGVAVIVPSLIAMVMSLVAVVGAIF